MLIVVLVVIAALLVAILFNLAGIRGTVTAASDLGLESQRRTREEVEAVGRAVSKLPQARQWDEP